MKKFKFNDLVWYDRVVYRYIGEWNNLYSVVCSSESPIKRIPKACRNNLEDIHIQTMSYIGSTLLNDIHLFGIKITIIASEDLKEVPKLIKLLY